MSDFDEHLASLRSVRLADLQLIELLHKQIRALDKRVGELETLVRRNAQLREATKPHTKVRGLYCNYCGKPFDPATKTKSLFCSRACSNRWHHQHPGLTAQPKLSRNGDTFQSTIVAGEGERRQAEG